MIPVTRPAGLKKAGGVQGFSGKQHYFTERWPYLIYIHDYGGVYI